MGIRLQPTISTISYLDLSRNRVYTKTYQLRGRNDDTPWNLGCFRQVHFAQHPVECTMARWWTQQTRRDELRWNQNASDYEALTGNLRSVEHWGAWPKWQHSSRSIQPSTPSSFKQEPVCRLKPNLHNLITVAGDACALALYFCGPCQWSPYARTTPIPRAQQACDAGLIWHEGNRLWQKLWGVTGVTSMILNRNTLPYQLRNWTDIGSTWYTWYSWICPDVFSEIGPHARSHGILVEPLFSLSLHIRRKKKLAAGPPCSRSKAFDLSTCERPWEATALLGTKVLLQSTIRVREGRRWQLVEPAVRAQQK